GSAGCSSGVWWTPPGSSTSGLETGASGGGLSGDSEVSSGGEPSGSGEVSWSAESSGADSASRNWPSAATIGSTMSPTRQGTATVGRLSPALSSLTALMTGCRGEALTTTSTARKTADGPVSKVLYVERMRLGANPVPRRMS